MVFLHELPPEHPDRNRPLVGAWYQWRQHTKLWKEVKETFKIAGKTYNELALAWTENDRFTFDRLPN